MEIRKQSRIFRYTKIDDDRMNLTTEASESCIVRTNKRLLTAYTPLRSRAGSFLIPKSLPIFIGHTSLIKGISSEIPTGIYTFSLLYKISQRYPKFSITIPDTIIFNSGFDCPTVISNRQGFLEFMPYRNGMNNLRNEASCLFFQKNSENTCDTPGSIIKYSNHMKLIQSTQEELIENWPDIYKDTLIQRFIKPKGLRASRVRVILKENSSPRIYVFTNIARTDNREDPSLRTKKKEIQSIEQDIKIFEEVQKTIYHHNEIKKFINSQSLEDILRPRTCSKQIHFSPISPGKIKAFNLFRDNFRIKRKPSFANNSLLERFITRDDMNHCHIYEGKIQSYEKPLEIALYLYDKINKYFFKNLVLSELSVDFIQRNDGVYFLQKIASGKTKPISKFRFQLSVNKSHLTR
ncbi:unnamed protein product [Blepharisma stoltei]|uniref:Uncharacterized protein n=1 Tax=Blepharisma stoltei TaxID=1481888 RepID=A0AAU9IPZ8_9CILI|nr:unnamed protein product [Blepharisma stoltei]